MGLSHLCCQNHIASKSRRIMHQPTDTSRHPLPNHVLCPAPPPPTLSLSLTLSLLNSLLFVSLVFLFVVSYLLLFWCLTVFSLHLFLSGSFCYVGGGSAYAGLPVSWRVWFLNAFYTMPWAFAATFFLFFFLLAVIF